MTTVEQPITEDSQERTYKRFTASQRFEHIILLITFTVLGITGLAQRYAGIAVVKDLIQVLGGIESIRVLHRIMATVLMAEVIYHGGIVSYKLFVLGRRAGMMPRWRDVRDVIQWVGFNLGFRAEPPKMPRYNFGEKAEYLAVVWGTVVMVITGFILWNPISTKAILPGQIIPAARLAHSTEALLAVVSILIWHMYNVHIKRFNKSIFTGKLDHEAMMEEHGEELERILEEGEDQPEFPPEVIARRRRLFIPYATIIATLLVIGLVWFVTYEQTAILTVARESALTQPINVDQLLRIANSERGLQLWQTAGCTECHGQQAEGGDGLLNIPLAGTTHDIETFIGYVRRGPADMPSFTPSEVSNEDAADIWRWLTSLDAPEPR